MHETLRYLKRAHRAVRRVPPHLFLALFEELERPVNLHARILLA